MLWNILYEYVLPGFLIAVMGSVFLLAKPLTTALTKWLERNGVEIEESRQRMFQTGLENAAKAVIRRAGGGKVTDLLLDHGVRHMHEGVPDAVAYFHATDEQIKRRVADRVDDRLRDQGATVALNVTETVPFTFPAGVRVSGSSEPRP